METYIGTSGWYYDWNEERTLDWYMEHSGLNAIELNASFYRLPFPNQVKSWVKKGQSLHWVIKVNRLITHQFKFSEKALTIWKKFYDLFSDLHTCIDYFLFQLPPHYTTRARNNIASFIKHTKMTEKCALEPRHESWFCEDMLDWASALGITWVSIDAPVFTRDICKTTDTVYLRVHGRTAWYSHDYTARELKEIAHRIIAAKPKRVYVFFNNNHAMLSNAQKMMSIITKAT